MVDLITTPAPQTLLPPLLACLPTAFASSRPPPSLLPLLSPVLRQRLQLITSSQDNWLRLLCWDRNQADSLHDIVENADFEPHPASGEIEVGEVDDIRYKRFDSETLRAHLGLNEWHLSAFYLWCTGSEEGSGWKLAELLPYNDGIKTDLSWSSSIHEANSSSRDRLVSEALNEAQSAERKPCLRADEDDYWAQYDKSPGRTPAVKRSPGPNQMQTSEQDYYSRYGDVQPAMDGHDPTEDMEGVQDSSLDGNVLSNILSQRSQQPRNGGLPPYEEPHEDLQDAEFEEGVVVNQPVPSSPSSHGSDMVARLEKTASQYAASEVAVKQHISTSMKSMYRLARSSGMDREEFGELVQRELQTLSLLDRDD